MTDVAQDRITESHEAEDVIDVEVLGVQDVPRGDGGTATAPVPPTGDDLAAQLSRVQRERDEFLDLLQRTKADFANYRHRMIREQAAERDQAAATVIDRLMPVLDAIDGARIHHSDAIEPVDAVLHPALVAIGVELIDPAGEPFDPDAHDAVVANDDELGDDGQVVAEVLRPGYRCRGRLLRPAMVRVGNVEG